MNNCPYCNSDDIFFSLKKNLYVCGNCNKTFIPTDIVKNTNVPNHGSGLKLFFSYGHDHNRGLVEKIKDDLEKRGHHVWIDTSRIKPGDNWRKDIVDGVINSAKIVAFLSSYSTRKPCVCIDELKIAVCVKGASVKTVLLESENKVQPPSTISDIQWLDMSDWSNIKNSHEKDFEAWYNEKFKELCNVIESSDTIELNGEISYIKGKLSPNLDTEKEYKLLEKDFLGREWLNRYIKKWQEENQSNALIIYGKPGSGKSAYCANYAHYNSDVLGCFLCEWNKSDTIDVRNLIRTIAFRIATKLPDYRSLLIDILNETDHDLRKMGAEDLFECILSYPLNNLVDGERKTGLIIVDGLDEADDNGRNHLAEVFSLCIQRLPKWIKFIFTSRPEKSVSIHFHSCDSIDIVENMPNGYNDMTRYLMNSLRDELQGVSNQLELLNQISELSEGIFLYAVLLVEEIRNKSININEIGLFPKGLNAFYLTSMRRKFKTGEDFKAVRTIFELLCVADTIPESIVEGVSKLSHYEYLKSIDKVGAWVNFTNSQGTMSLGFCHKSIKDWLTDSSRSGDYYVDAKKGALDLANYCKEHLEDVYARNHIGAFYILAEAYTELEDFLMNNHQELNPYWKIWNKFPREWNNDALLNIFWNSANRNSFLSQLQKEGDSEFVLWIFSMAKDKYGIDSFDRELISIYIDLVHLSGKYSESVDLINSYLSKIPSQVILNDKYLLMLKIRKLHHSAFFTPVNKLLDEAIDLYTIIINHHDTSSINELLIFMGGKYALIDEWEKSIEWLRKSDDYANEKGHENFHKRNIRRMCEYYFHADDMVNSLCLIPDDIKKRKNISNRYDAYLYCTLANIYTGIDGKEDDAIMYYHDALRYFTVKGISGWIAHAHLGIANVNFKIGNYEEAIDYASRAKNIYQELGQEWGIIMSRALISISENKIVMTAPMEVLCEDVIALASQMHFFSCIASIKDLCCGKYNYLKLYFI